MFDDQVYLDELYRDHEIAAEIFEDGGPLYKENWPGF